MHQFKYIFIAAVLVVFTQLRAQDTATLTKMKAVSEALAHNYGIKMAKSSAEIAKNNSELLNTGHFPKISLNAGVNQNISSVKNNLQDGTELTINNKNSTGYNGSVGLNYVIFDGFGRKYNYEKLKTSYNLSELAVRQIIENTVLQLFHLYYNVARFTETTTAIRQSLRISQNRLKRTQYGYAYGQYTKLDILNAQVDLNQDSISLLNTNRLLANAKRDLNQLLGRAISAEFTVDTSIQFSMTSDLEILLEKSRIHNVEIQKSELDIAFAQSHIQASKASFLPKLQLNSSYGFTGSNNDNTFNYAQQLSRGLNAGINLSWNIFDGTLKTKVNNAKITEAALHIEKESIASQLERDVYNAYETYSNNLRVLQAEEENVATNKINFQRTQELFKLGQLNSIVFRQAQLNLLNAISFRNAARYDAKNAELQLLQLTGELMTVSF